MAQSLCFFLLGRGGQIRRSPFATGRSQAFPEPEVNHVEETAANVGVAFCVDKSRLFIEGFSSGSWIRRSNEYPGGRDHVLKLNKCTMPAATAPYDPGPMVKAPNGGSTITCASTWAVRHRQCFAPPPASPTTTR